LPTATLARRGPSAAGVVHRCAGRAGGERLV